MHHTHSYPFVIHRTTDLKGRSQVVNQSVNIHHRRSHTVDDLVSDYSDAYQCGHT
jgi:hypothetical protein